MSTDPTLGDYVPEAGKGNAKDSANLPGMGGVYNVVNFNLYHYGANNPVKYVDPDGKFIISAAVVAKIASGAVIGAAVGAITNVAVQVGSNLIKNGGNVGLAIDNIDINSVLTSALSGAISGAITGGVGEVSTAYNAITGSKSYCECRGKRRRYYS